MSQTIVLMSDIHGNFAALQAVNESLPAHDAVYVAGDLCLEGPEPDRVIDFVREQGWTAVMGNTDRGLLEPPPDPAHASGHSRNAPRSRTPLGVPDGAHPGHPPNTPFSRTPLGVPPSLAQTGLPPKKRKKWERIAWTRELLGQERLDWLATLPFSARCSNGTSESTILIVHANPLDMDTHLQPTMSEEELRPYLEPVNAGMLAFGHLHIPYLRPVGGILLADVSSVGHPKDLDLRAAYTVVRFDGERRSVEQVRVVYDVERAVRILRESDMPFAEEQAQDLLRASY